jgi:hypothetical protein
MRPRLLLEIWAVGCDRRWTDIHCCVLLLDTPRRALIPRLVMLNDEASEGEHNRLCGVTNRGPMEDTRACTLVSGLE